MNIGIIKGCHQHRVLLYCIHNCGDIAKCTLRIIKGLYIYISRLTVVSHEAKKKQHACVSSGPHDHYSGLFTRIAALKF